MVMMMMTSQRFTRHSENKIGIWPHGQEKLMEFLNHLNGIHNKIQFTMEIEEAGHLPFLDIDIYRKMDCSLGHKVYRKPTHTNLYLHQKSRHPANKHPVLSSLVHKAKSLCDQESLAPELTFLTNVFKQNGYSHQQIQRAMKPATRTNKTYRTPKLHTADPVECWPNTISKASPYHPGKYQATCHQPKMH